MGNELTKEQLGPIRAGAMAAFLNGEMRGLDAALNAAYRLGQESLRKDAERLTAFEEHKWLISYSLSGRAVELIEWGVKAGGVFGRGDPVFGGKTVGAGLTLRSAIDAAMEAK